MASFYSGFVQTTDSVLIHISFSGPRVMTRTTVVFLHYWGGSTRTWAGVASRIASCSTEDGFQTASVDFRGWGLSKGPDKASNYSIENLARDVVDVLALYYRKKMINDRVILVGLSMGAKVTQVVAHVLRQNKAAMELVGVVLVSPAPATSMQLPLNMAQRQIRAYDNAETALFVARNVLTESWKGHNKDKKLPGYIVEDMLKGNRWARAAWPTYAMAENVMSMSLSTLRPEQQRQHIPNTPVLVLAAEKDAVEPIARVRADVFERIPGAELHIIRGSGHLSPIDAPGEVANAIIGFIKKQSAVDGAS